MHNPGLEPLNMGATFGHIMDKLYEKGDASIGQTAGAVAKSALGTVEETPFASVPNEIVKTITNPQTLGEFFGQLIAGAIEPPDLGRAAKAMDLDPEGNVVQREKGIWQTPASNIPGVRNLIPIKEEKTNLEKSGLKDSKEIKEVQAQEERVRKFRQAVINDKSGGRDLEIKKQRYLKADRDLKQMKHNKKDYRKYENFLREKEIEESKKTGKGRRGVYRLLKSGGG